MLWVGIGSIGRIGARKRLDYTCIGNAVTVAARIEGLTKMYGMAIFCGADTAAWTQGLARFAGQPPEDRDGGCRAGTT